MRTKQTVWVFLGVSLALVAPAFAQTREAERARHAAAADESEEAKEAREQAEKEKEKAKEKSEKARTEIVVQKEALREQARRNVEVSRGRSRDERTYQRALERLDAREWDQALAAFDEVLALNESRVDAALYWKAYSL